MKEIKALVLCGNRFAIPSIQQLAYAGLLKAVAVPEGLDEIAEYAEAVLKSDDIPVVRITAAGYTNELKAIIKKHEINIGLMLTFSYKIPAAVYDLPEFGFYNFHPGPLPSYRGPDPIFQQIKNMEEYAGIVIHKTDENFDTGPVIISEKIKIEPEDTYGLLTTKLATKAASMLGVLLKMISLGIDPPEKKQDNSRASYYKKQGADEVVIKWDTMSAAQIAALANACNPWNKGALTGINNMIIRIPAAKKAAASQENDLLPGTIISVTENELLVSTLNKEALSISFIHLEEGFFAAGRLATFGISAGAQFKIMN